MATKKNSWVWILIALVIIILISIIYLQGSKIHQLKLNQGPSTVPDTTRIDDYFDVEDSYDEKINPSTVKIYLTDTVYLDSIQVKHDTVFIFSDSIIEVKSNFLVEYPKAPKLLQLLLDNNQLDLSLFYPSGDIVTEVYPLNLTSNSYNWVNNQMSTKKKSFISKLHPKVELWFRPVHMMLDLNLGINYKTKGFIYGLGLNTFYYPKYTTYPGIDIYFKLGYEF